ncbi:VRR-NUC domain-containing protein [Burkholderia sp. Tr-20355]|uniref:VRR-NUC domain-containing protein n=1 Tax=Burkholderia sp. Tr-20355 TaxID=2703895 RepID=UPI001981E3F5|nr:VRR-NUC domain-containing protein [Burkholderia sp. Tr-20355]
MLEKTVETYLVDRVRAAGGDAYKFSSPARVSVPDRIVVFPPARIYFVELKRPGGKPTRGQEREHERLRALGCDVRVIDNREAVDAFVREASAHRYHAPADDREIFLVMANTMYEGSDPARAFASKEAADAFAQRCRDYEDARKPIPEIDTPQSEWDSWYASDRAWEQAHPAAPFSRRDSYDVTPLAFEPATNGDAA